MRFLREQKAIFPCYQGNPDVVASTGDRRQTATAVSTPRSRSRPAPTNSTMTAKTGEITPGEAAELARVVEIYARAVEVTDFDRRLRQLEEDRSCMP
jgi:hypothetical protein